MLTIRADGDWGGALLSDVEAVVCSAAATLLPLEEHEALTISLQPTPSIDDPPITLSVLNGAGEFVVQLNVRGNLWAQLAFQFAHEFCHVLANILTWRGPRDRFAWIEEVFCESASLVALRAMAMIWAKEPPYPNWLDYAIHLESYAADRMADPAQSLPAGLIFSNWMAQHLPLLESDPGRREDNTVIAKELLPIFETDSNGWRAIRHLHTWKPPSTATLAEFLDGWEHSSPPECRPAITSIGAVICPK
jgi:hypothetical protein